MAREPMQYKSPQVLNIWQNRNNNNRPDNNIYNNLSQNPTPNYHKNYNRDNNRNFNNNNHYSNNYQGKRPRPNYVFICFFISLLINSSFFF